MILSLEAPNKFGKSISEFGETHSSVFGCERRPVSASITRRSCFASFFHFHFSFSSHYLNNIIFIDNNLGPLARESYCIRSVKNDKSNNNNNKNENNSDPHEIHFITMIKGCRVRIS